jgi:alpha-tubulin suppressor-like RCC1 family protein
MSDVVAVSAGGPGEIMTGWFDGHSLALKNDGTVWEWGCQPVGGWSTPFPGASKVLSQAVAIAAGGQHSLALREDGTVLAWGWDGYGELGSLAGLTGVVAIAGGNLYSLAAKSDGTVLAWGLNDSGQLGDGSGKNRSTPEKVSGLPPLLPDRLVVNAASLRRGAVAPGEIVSIYGIGLASSDAKMAKPDNAGMFEKALVHNCNS